MEFNVRFLNGIHHGSRRSPTLWLPLGLLWPSGRHLSQWFPAPTASHGRAPPWRAPEAPRHSSPPGPPRCCGTARSYICNQSIKYDFFLSLPQLHSSVLQWLPAAFNRSTQIKNVMNKNCKKWSGKINYSTNTHTHTYIHKHTNWPLCTLQSLLSMHQLRHLCSQPFVCEAFTWILPLLLHQPLHLCQRKEGEQLQVPVKNNKNNNMYLLQLDSLFQPARWGDLRVAFRTRTRVFVTKTYQPGFVFTYPSTLASGCLRKNW